MEDPQTFSNREDQNNLVESIKAKLSILVERPVNLSIYKVPTKIRRLDEDAYSPRVVSIGPFHHRNNPDLLAMEDRKWRHMLSLLERTKDIKECLNACGKVVMRLEARARGSYAECINFDSRQLPEIMLVDGCFILELFLRHFLKDTVNDYTDAWMVPTLRRDLALLENQIPFFLLEHLFDVVLSRMAKHLPVTVTGLALSFFHPELDLGKEVIREKCSQGSNTFHLFDLLRNFYLPKSPRMDTSIRIGTWGFKNCATELLEAGIEIKKGSEEDGLLGIKFSKGVIKIPTLWIHGTTHSLLRNFTAFEQCSPASTVHFMSYAILMRSLIRSRQDVELLERIGIIKKDLVGVEDVLSLFNNIWMEIALTDFYFGSLCEEVNEYHESFWHWQRHRVFWKVRGHRYAMALKHDYFSNPWRIIAFAAAVLLLLLTGLQTFYSVRSYYPH